MRRRLMVIGSGALAAGLGAASRRGRRVGGADAATPVSGASPAPGAVLALRGTPHVWIADEQGVLHWTGDGRALAGRAVDWGTWRDVPLEVLRGLPRGEPWLSAGLVAADGALHLAHWEFHAPAPRLLRVASLADAELFGLDGATYGRLVLDAAAWERRFGLPVPSLRRGELAPAVGAPPDRPAAVPLEGTLWRLTAARGPDGALAPAPAGDAGEATAEFTGEPAAADPFGVLRPAPAPAPGGPRALAFTGYDGCNRFEAAYEAAGGALTLRLGMSTLRGCSDAVQALALAYTRALEAVRRFAVVGRRLALQGAGDEPLLEFAVAEPLPLAATVWRGGVYYTGRSLSSGRLGFPRTAVFGVDGTVTGALGCTAYAGAYTTDGGRIRIEARASQEGACADPSEVRAEVPAYLAALSLAETYVLRGRELTLLRAGGYVAAAFGGAPPLHP